MSLLALFIVIGRFAVCRGARLWLQGDSGIRKEWTTDVFADLTDLASSFGSEECLSFVMDDT